MVDRCITSLPVEASVHGDQPSGRDGEYSTHWKRGRHGVEKSVQFTSTTTIDKPPGKHPDLLGYGRVILNPHKRQSDDNDSDSSNRRRSEARWRSMKYEVATTNGKEVYGVPVSRRVEKCS